MSLFLDDTEPATLVLTRASSSASTGEWDPTSRRVKKQLSFKLTPALLRTILTVALGSGMMYGYNFSLVNNCETVLKTHMNESFFTHYGNYLDSNSMDLFWHFVIAALPIGAIFGCFASHFCSHKLGRKRFLIVNNCVGVIGASLQLWASMSRYVEVFVLGRVVTGAYCGIIATVAPVYLSEIAPVHQRGYITSTFQLGNVAGTTLALFFGLSNLLGSKRNFHYLFIISLVIPFLQTLLLKFCPESPRFLLLFKSDAFGAMQSLRRLRNCPDVSEDLAEIDNEILQNSEDAINQNRARSMLRFSQILSKPNLRRMLVICICMHASQSLTGITVMLSYSSTILSELFGTNLNSLFSDSVVYAFLIPFTLVATLFVEKLGRRFLHLSGVLGSILGAGLVMFAFLYEGKFVILATNIIRLAGLSIFLCSYAIGPGPMPWLMVPELVPSSARSSIASFSVITNLVISLVVTLTYPLLKSEIGPRVFVIFMTASFCVGLVLFFALPETKRKTADEILLSAAENAIKIPSCCRCWCMSSVSRHELDVDNELYPTDSDPLF